MKKSSQYKKIIGILLLTFGLIEIGLHIESYFLKSRVLSPQDKVDLIIVGDSIAAQLYESLQRELGQSKRILPETYYTATTLELAQSAQKTLQKINSKLVLSLFGNQDHNKSLLENKASNFPFRLRTLEFIKSLLKNTDREKSGEGLLFLHQKLITLYEEEPMKLKDFMENDLIHYPFSVQFVFSCDPFQGLPIYWQERQTALEAYYQANKQLIAQSRQIVNDMIQSNSTLNSSELQKELYRYHYRSHIKGNLDHQLHDAKAATPYALMMKVSGAYNSALKNDKRNQDLIENFLQYDLPILDSLLKLAQRAQKESKIPEIKILLKRYSLPEFEAADILSFLNSAQNSKYPIEALKSFFYFPHLLSKIYGIDQLRTKLFNQYPESLFTQELKKYENELSTAFSAESRGYQPPPSMQQEILQAHELLAQTVVENGGTYVILQYPGHSDDFLRTHFFKRDHVIVYNLSLNLMDQVNSENYYTFFKDRIGPASGHLTKEGLAIVVPNLLAHLNRWLQAVDQHTN